MKKIATTRFGEIEVNEDHIVHFKDGMIGFHKLKQYTLIESTSMPLILWLQSLEEPDVAFPLVEPFFFKKDFKINMTDADRHSLNFVEGDRTKLLVVMTIPENMVQMTVNLKAPIVIDINRASAAQVILQDRTLEVRTPAHEGFTRALSHFTLEQSASEVKLEDDRFSAVNVRTVVNQGFSATV